MRQTLETPIVLCSLIFVSTLLVFFRFRSPDSLGPPIVDFFLLFPSPARLFFFLAPPLDSLVCFLAIAFLDSPRRARFWFSPRLSRLAHHSFFVIPIGFEPHRPPHKNPTRLPGSPSPSHSRHFLVTSLGQKPGCSYKFHGSCFSWAILAIEFFVFFPTVCFHASRPAASRKSHFIRCNHLACAAILPPFRPTH